MLIFEQVLNLIIYYLAISLRSRERTVEITDKTAAARMANKNPSIRNAGPNMRETR